MRTHFAVIVTLLSVVGAALAAMAQEPPRPDPLETNLAAQWQASQTAQQNVADAITKLLEAYRQQKARADAAETKLKAAADAAVTPGAPAK